MRVIHYTLVHLTMSVGSKTSLSPAGNSMFLSKGLQWSCSDYPHHMSSCVQPVSRHPPTPPHSLLYLHVVLINHIQILLTSISAACTPPLTQLMNHSPCVASISTY